MLNIRYACLGRNSGLWYIPPVNIFLLKVTMSGAVSNSKCSWAQSLPVGPPPVWTSSTRYPMSYFAHIFWRPYGINKIIFRCMVIRDINLILRQSNMIISKNAQLTWNQALLPWKSPPSDWIGSTINPTTGVPSFLHLSIVSSTWAKHRLSSASFSLTKSSSGYLKNKLRSMWL